MPKSGEFYTFDEVLRKMSIDEQRLKKLVSEGEIRAFREGQEMKFRRADIDNMNKTRPTAGAEDATAAIDLSAGGHQPSETLTDDLIFDEGDDVGAHETGMATAEISSQDTFVEEGVGMSTEPLEVEGEEPKTMEAAPAGKKGGARSAGPAKPMTRRAPAAPPEPATELGWSVALTLGAFALLGGAFVAWDIGRSDSTGAKSSGFSTWVGNSLGGVDNK